MRSGWMIFTAALAFVALPQVSRADDADVQEQLRQMQERMRVLEDKLQNTTDQLDAATAEVNEQKQVMSNAGLRVDESGASGIDSFLQSLEIGGWVNISYWHNFNNPGNGNCPDDFLVGLANDGNSGSRGRVRSDCFSLLPASLNANTGNGATSLGYTSGMPKNLLPGGFFNPTNPDSQGFSFDQVWFEIGRPTSPEQRSGFRFDVAMGKIADILQARSSNNSRDARSDNDIYIHQANIQYLADLPWLGDVNVTVGKFSTLVGYEAPQATYNHNISRGILWGFFQPVDHLGVLLSGTVDRRYHFLGSEGQIDWDMGIVNGFDADDPDVNHSKTFTARARMTGENWSIQVGGLVGKEDGGPVHDTCGENPNNYDGHNVYGTICDLIEQVIANRSSVNPNNLTATNVGFGGSESDTVTLFDLIMTWDPFTDLSLYLNFDHMWAGSYGYDPTAWGIAVGGTYTINERLTFTLRNEYLRWDDSGGTLLGFTNVRLPYGSNDVYATGGCQNQWTNGGRPCQIGTAADVASITATLAYQLTDQIKVRGELRWDNFQLYGRRGNAGLNASDQQFNEGSPCYISGAQSSHNCGDLGAYAQSKGGDSDQWVGGMDVIYEF